MSTKQFLQTCIDQAMGREKADLVIKHTRFLNVTTGEIAQGDIAICQDRIIGTYEHYHGEQEIDGRDLIAVPGFIDTHVHCESTLVTPYEFDRCVLPHGTTTAICDPHEIANVLGVPGIQYFLDCADHTVMDLRVQLSSCVPATHLETAGAELLAEHLVPLRGHAKVLGLAEFMNYPGLLHKDPQVMDKLAAFFGDHIDGHAPLLGGRELNAYLACGIRNCHETTSIEEGREKLRKGMQLLMREGTVSKDLKTLVPLLSTQTASFCGFCTDDRNPLDIAEEGHMDYLIRTAIAEGAEIANVYRAASWSAARAFRLFDRGLIAPGQRADIVLLNDLASCDIAQVINAGQTVTDARYQQRPQMADVGRNSIKRSPVQAEDFRVSTSEPSGPVIGINPGSIVTDCLSMTLPYKQGYKQADPEQDVLKACVLERHGKNGNIGRAFVRGFGFKQGAIAASVGHDSHNLCVIGASDAEMALAVNRLIELGGGFVAVREGTVLGELALPIAGLMSDQPYEQVHQKLIHLRQVVREMGCPLSEPFLQMAFLPLPVIPHLKLTDMGLVDVDRFELIAA